MRSWQPEGSLVKESWVTLIALDDRTEMEPTGRLRLEECTRRPQRVHRPLQAHTISKLSTGRRLGDILSPQWSEMQRDRKG